MNDLGITNYWWFFVKNCDVSTFIALWHSEYIWYFDVYLSWLQKDLQVVVQEKMFNWKIILEINFIYEFLLVSFNFCENCYEIEIPRNLEIQTKLVNLKIFREINLCKIHELTLISRKLRQLIIARSGNFGILLPRFSQIFRQINVLLKNFTINWFDGKNFAWQWISRFSTLCHTVSGKEP